MQINIHNSHFFMLPQKAIVWKEMQALLISDPHFGKGAHFRKHGSYVPKNFFLHDLKMLEQMLLQIKPEKLLILGDMFHSEFNEECLAFFRMIHQFKELQTILIKGNHDILPKEFYLNWDIDVVQKFDYENISLTHEPHSGPQNDVLYNICGHIHPAIEISGRGKQTLKLPCYVFGKTQGIMPAFGSFKGNKIIKAQSGDRIFVIAGEQILEV